MSLAPGTRLGPYEIVAPLGAGGMGEVYRARDTRLGREVAVKVLPQHLSANPEVRARFEREAKTVSALNHPNICTLFDVGREGETDFLVMELVDGETLAQRLTHGALPAAEVLKIGGQIADALDRAHRAGVVHRDLKPGNVMLTKGGAKLMDFGLARATGLATASGSGSRMATMSHSPTMAAPLTAEGTIVGTFQYMAPEQLEGKEADARSDIWAFGCVLYEMVTGKRAFDGSTQASLISAIMRDTPRPMADLAPMSPPALERVVGQCLAKDPDERWQSAGDVKRALEWSGGVGPASGASIPLPPRPAMPAWPAIAGAVVAGAVVASLAWWVLAPRAPQPATAVLDLPTPPGARLESAPGYSAISPDGRWLAYVAADSNAVEHLFVRALDAPVARMIESSAHADHPFWSPDSRWIVYFTSGDGAGLRKVPVDGGTPVKLCDVTWSRGGTWGKHGDIVFSPGPTTPLSRIAAIGGPVTPATVLDSTRHETSHRNPYFLPDGDHFVYAALPQMGDGWNLLVGSLHSHAVKLLGTAGSAATWAPPGYLVFAREGQLVAQRFDLGKLELVGDVIPLAVGAARGDEEASRFASVSANGRIVVTRSDPPLRHLEWFGRDGRSLGSPPVPSDLYGGVVLSHDDRHAAVGRTTGGIGLQAMRIDLDRGILTALTDPRTYNAPTCWSPDDRTLAVNTTSQGGRFGIALVPADGSSPPRVLPTGPAQFQSPTGFTPDGKQLLMNEIMPGGQRDLFLVDAVHGGEIHPVATESGNQENTAVTPDGRWVIYDSDATGTKQIFARSLPDGADKVQLSTGGGSEPVVTRGGREVIFVGADRHSVYSIALDLGGSSAPEAEKLLFRVPFTIDPYAVSATSDGQRFLILVPDASSRPPSTTVIVDWAAELRNRGR